MKRLFILLLLVLSPYLLCQAQNEKSRPTVAVVLSGGGAKGVAHISALKAIEDAGIPIDIICGTSMGSLIGALYSIGYSTDFLDSLVRAQDWTFLLSDRTDPASLTLQQKKEQNTYAFIRGLSKKRAEQGGLIRGRNLAHLFRQLCTGYLDSISFDSMPIRFACVATDIVTNTEVDFHSGYLTQAMRASMAIPGVFTPVRMGDSVLVDGGMSNNLPVDVAQKMGADVIISVTVQNDLLTADEITDAASVLNQIIDLNCKKKYYDNLTKSDILMRVDVRGFTAASFTSAAIDSLLRRGAEEAANHRDELLLLSARIQYTPEAFDLSSKRTSIPDSTTDGVAYRRRPPTPLGLVSSIPIASAGFRFDSEEMGVVQLNIKYPLNKGIPMGFEGTLRLGKQLMAKAEMTLLPRKFTSPSISYTFGRHDVDIYNGGLRTYNVKYRTHTVNISPFNFKVRNFTLKAGIQWDNYDYFGRLLTVVDASSVPELSDKNFFSYNLTSDLNTEDHWYFPRKGTRLHTSLAYRTDNFIGYQDEVGITDISAHWRVNIPMGRHFSVQPMLYGRIVMTDNLPPAYLNAIGGEWFGHNLEQQMPFAGLGNSEYIERHFVGLQLQCQYRLLKNHYILLRFATALHSGELENMFSLPDIYGVQAGYSYNTLLGPIDLRFGYNNLTRKPNFYFNIGHCF